MGDWEGGKEVGVREEAKAGDKGGEMVDFGGSVGVKGSPRVRDGGYVMLE